MNLFITAEIETTVMYLWYRLL